MAINYFSSTNISTVVSLSANYFTSKITLLTRALHTKRKVARLEYASRAIFTDFSFLWRQPAKIHISNVRRRIRETMSTKPRDSSKMISGGPRNGPPPPSYHAARHTERKNIERVRARVRSVTLKFVVFLKHEAASSCFTRWFWLRSPFFRRKENEDEEGKREKKQNVINRRRGPLKRGADTARRRRRRCTGCFWSGDTIKKRIK